ncbi:MAG: glycosyltransferase family 2 protein [Blastocatellia bacterium]
MNRTTILSPEQHPQTDHNFLSAASIKARIATLRTDYLLLQFQDGASLDFSARALDRMVQVADDTGAGILYADFRDRRGAEISDHPLIDYQTGSVRDNFDFGAMVLISRAAATRALAQFGPAPAELRFGGWYDLRLKISAIAPVIRLSEPLYTRVEMETRTAGEKHFDYVDPRQRDYQVEMEQVATAHLKRIGAFLEPVFADVPAPDTTFPVLASVVIPVRNRVKTIGDAVRGVLTQQTGFAFNVIVVDNFSTDGTTDILRELAQSDPRVAHLVPARTDLGIGGCWNEAVYAAHCGRYAVQLDSDDLYQSEDTLAKIVAAFGDGRYAMVIGSYTLVDFDLHEIPPGLIDHREWTRENGRNNALRINGLGAPRAFDTSVLRRYGLPNTSYGEDYAIALRISRDYEIGRIYDSVYLCRRWGGNSDSALPLATMNRYDAYKDRLRTIEIMARQLRNTKGAGTK